MVRVGYAIDPRRKLVEGLIETGGSRLSSYITCPGCKHKLMLPEEVMGQRVQCPKCSAEFTAQTSPVPAMEVEPETPSAEPALPVRTSVPAKSATPPPLETAYEGAEPGRSPAWPAIFCVVCGARFSRTADACPRCGHPVHERPEDSSTPGRRPRKRILQPIRAFLPITAAILVPVGLVLMACAPLADDLLRRSPPPIRFWVPFLFGAVGGVTELVALICCVAWLYQAWRIVLAEDEDYSPGLMVGLLFVPFFNLYWIFRAIPGLSAAIHKELSYFGPRASREASSVPGAGWIPGLVACIIALVPYAQPIAVCVFLAWMLIANHAIQRLVRFHDGLDDEG